MKGSKPMDIDSSPVTPSRSANPAADHGSNAQTVKTGDVHNAGAAATQAERSVAMEVNVAIVQGQTAPVASQPSASAQNTDSTAVFAPTSEVKQPPNSNEQAKTVPAAQADSSAPPYLKGKTITTTGFSQGSSTCPVLSFCQFHVKVCFLACALLSEENSVMEDIISAYGGSYNRNFNRLTSILIAKVCSYSLSRHLSEMENCRALTSGYRLVTTACLLSLGSG